MRCAHAAHRFAGAGHRAQHVDAHHPLPARPALGVDLGGDIHHARAVDEASDGAQRGINISKHAHDLCLVPHIGLHGHGGATGVLYAFDHVAGGLRIAGVIDGDGPTLLCRQNGRGGSDAAAGACD